MVELPAFFTLSGMLMKRKREELSVTELIVKDCENLLWPYFTFSFLLFLIGPAGISLKLVKALITKETFEFVILMSQPLCFITSWGAGSVWFLFTLFFSRTILWIIRKTKKSMLWSAIVICIGILLSVFIELHGYEFDDFMSGANCWYLIAMVARVCICYGFVLFGYTFSNKLFQIPVNIKTVLFSAIGMVACSLISIFCVGESLNLRYSCLHECWFTLPVALISLVCLFVLCKALSMTKFNSSKIGETFKWFGINSLIIMGIQNYLGLIAPQLEKILSNFMNGFVLAIVTLVGSMLLFTIFAVLVVIVVNRKCKWIIRIG